MASNKLHKVSLTLSNSFRALFIATNSTSACTVLAAALDPLFVAISSFYLMFQLGKILNFEEVS